MLESDNRFFQILSQINFTYNNSKYKFIIYVTNKKYKNQYPLNLLEKPFIYKKMQVIMENKINYTTYFEFIFK